MLDPRRGDAGHDRTWSSKRIEASWEEIPAIFITAQKDQAIRQQALKQGAVNFLYKPFSDTALLEALNAAVQANWTCTTARDLGDILWAWCAHSAANWGRTHAARITHRIRRWWRYLSAW
jgi:DNA-binding NtrC family response regulator